MLGQHTDLPLRNDGRAGRRSLLQIKLTPEVLQQILAQQGKGLQLDFDDKALLLGESKFPFSLAPESAALDVYRCPRTTQEHLDLVGRVSHKVTVRRELANAITDKLKTRNAEAKAAKEGRSVQQIEVAPMHGGRNGLTKTIRPAASAVLSKGRQSPFLQARKSPLLVASSPKPSAVPLNTKLIQVLAAGASTIEELGGKLRASPDALQPLLQQVGRVHAGEWVLKDDMYAQVKVWDWRHYTTAERQQVISRATEAFDSLKLPATASARLKLVHPEKRNAASDSERSDTSPLSLNPPITAASVTSAPSSASVQASKESERKKPVTANGILSTGKVTKKRKADTPSSASPALSHAEVAASDTERPLERLSKRTDDKADKRSKQESNKSAMTERNASRLAVSQQRDRSTSRSRSQTFNSRKAPSVASSSGTSSSLEEAAAAAASHSHSGTSQRTSSMTSSSTDRSAVSASTVATSVSGRSPRREKEERPAKTVPGATSTASPVVTTTSKKSSIFESKRASPDKAKMSRPVSTEALASNKRKADAVDLDKDAAPASGQLAKRAKTSDLFELARQYKSQYPEYQALHAQVYVQKVADESVKAKFVKMHNDMKTWKQLLWSESEGQQRSALANR